MLNIREKHQSGTSVRSERILTVDTKFDKARAKAKTSEAADSDGIIKLYNVQSWRGRRRLRWADGKVVSWLPGYRLFSGSVFQLELCLGLSKANESSLAHLLAAICTILSVHSLASICHLFMTLHHCLLHFRIIRDRGESEVNEHTTKFIDTGTVRLPL